MCFLGILRRGWGIARSRQNKIESEPSSIPERNFDTIQLVYIGQKFEDFYLHPMDFLFLGFHHESGLSSICINDVILIMSCAGGWGGRHNKSTFPHNSDEMAARGFWLVVMGVVLLVFEDKDWVRQIINIPIPIYVVLSYILREIIV